MSTETGQAPRAAERLRKVSLDKDLHKLERVEEATRSLSRSLLAPGLALAFLAVSAVVAGVQIGAQPNALVLIAASVLAGYMALNIGANDVANNVGPAVGSRALTMTGALIIAAIFECAGALIAGGEVVNTISKGIIDPSMVGSSEVFIATMMAALIASAVWVNVATYVGAPVSTTHAVVGGVVGAGIAAAGFGIANWHVLAAIAASWVVSPLLGGIIAALFLAFIKANIIYRHDKIAAARLWVPALIAIMCSAFTAYLMMKGLSRIWKTSAMVVALVSGGVLVGSFLLLRPLIRRQSAHMENRNQSLRKLFHLPLICSAALLSFAHGANDVANAVGPLAGILHSSASGSVAGKVALPFWIMIIGAAGISIGLFLFGPTLIRTVGQEITRMNPVRAFCVSLSAAITVIVASALGLPVSSTHIAVGAVFGVGFFREYYTSRSRRRRDYMASKGARASKRREPALAEQQYLMRRKLVRRSHFTVVVAAWVITVPVAAVLAAVIFRVFVLLGI
ncbi:MAG: anion permease [Hyphomicrobiaceae bacterium]